MSFDLQGLRAAMATVITNQGWTEVSWADAPAESTTTDHSFSFGDPSRSDQQAMSSGGGVFTYAWDLQFVWHCEPESLDSATDGELAATTAVDALAFTANWPADVIEINCKSLGEVGARRAQENSRALVMRWRCSAMVYEAAPTL